MTPEPIDLRFPEKGLDLAAGYAEQRPGTAPVGVNVRVFEPATDRGRGGSRPGLSRYVDDQLPHVAALTGGVE